MFIIMMLLMLIVGVMIKSTSITAGVFFLTVASMVIDQIRDYNRRVRNNEQANN